MINSYVSKIIAEKEYILIRFDSNRKDLYGISAGLPYYKVVDKYGKIITHGTENVINAYFGMPFNY